MAKKFWIPVAAGVAALSLVGGMAVAQALHKNDVTIVVDGEPKTIAVREDTVAEVLELEQLEIGDHDVVLPGPDSRIVDGMEITVAYARPLEVVVDGDTRELWTTARTVGEALAYLDLDREDSKYSTSRSAAIGREGLAIEIATAMDVVVNSAAGAQDIRIAGTVADALSEAGITVDDDDQVTPELSTALTDDLQITYVNIEKQPRTEMVPIPFEKHEVKTDTLFKGESKVTTKGVEGAHRETWTDTYADGVLADSELVEKVISVQPVHQVTSIGTKAVATNGTAINLAREAMWDRIARCESTNRWNINTGNGYYGGLQFNLQTWRSVNGQDFAPYPHQATREQQITVANRLYAKRGTQPWSCA